MAYQEKGDSEQLRLQMTPKNTNSVDASKLEGNQKVNSPISSEHGIGFASD